MRECGYKPFQNDSVLDDLGGFHFGNKLIRTLEHNLERGSYYYTGYEYTALLVSTYMHGAKQHFMVTDDKIVSIMKTLDKDILTKEEKELFHELSKLWISACSIPLAERKQLLIKCANKLKDELDNPKTGNKYFEKEFYQHICHTQRTTVTCAGQTHIDVAWLWTIAQAREKAQRSYATVIAYMEKYKDYHFFCSQPVLYKAIKEEAPDLYKKIKEMVKEGRFEADGAMWVEADCNLISGESMVRQFLFGKRFFKEEFGIDSRILWLPDVFGYSAAMPQICKMSGVDSFVTSKISWNDTNTMPHDVFEWQGIDGTSLFTYFLTAQQITSNNKRNTTYNAEVSPNYLAGTYERFQDKGLSDDVLLAYGYGDGGGGPTVEQLEYIHRLERGIPGCPNAKISTVSSFLDELKEKTKGRLAKWVGELYLEFHRGTYTAIGKNKKNNRYAEFLLHNLETVCTMNFLLTGQL